MPVTTPVLRSARLELRPYRPDDEDAFVALFQDTEVSRWVGDGPDTAENDRALFRRLPAVYDEGRFAVWAVFAGEQYVGHAELKHTAAVDGLEFVYVLAREHWGKRMGTELAGTIVAHAFAATDIERLYATVHASNAASARVLQRLGFTHLRDIVEADATVLVYGLDRPAAVGDDRDAVVVSTTLPRDGDATTAGSSIGSGLSVISMQNQGAGYGPALHMHPYREVFVIYAGQAEFTVAEKTMVAGAGAVIVVPPFVAHKFRVIGDEPYTATDIHESAELVTIWLDDSSL